MEELNAMNYRLLKKWCDKLDDLQITERTSSGVYGGILCEGCGYIHGRQADVVYPMVTLYAKTGDKKYLECAKNAVLWQKNNVRKRSGFNINDTFCLWFGVTEFYLISLGLTLYEFGDILPKDLKKEWREEFDTVLSACFQNAIFIFREGTSVATNYLVAYLTANAVAYKVTGEEKYRLEAINQEDKMLGAICEEGHFYGEAGGRQCTDKGHKNIDLGYNIEESIGNFALYAKLLDREHILKLCAQMVKSSLEFMLPDGAWDNSWGSRGVKWTYYGSRTTDGASLALRLVADEEPLAYEACLRYTSLLESMTYSDLLSGGKMYDKAGITPCVHHAFAHAKTVAYVVNHPFEQGERTQLPRDVRYGFKEVKSAGVTLISKGEFRCTATATSLNFAGGQSIKGGSITCLYHNGYGVLLAGNGKYFSLIEPTNMQAPYDTDNICQTLRIDNGEYSSMLCSDACIKTDGNSYIATGRLESFSGKQSDEYTLKYLFEENEFKIFACGKGTLYLPFVCDYSEKVAAEKNSVRYGRISIKSDIPLVMEEGRFGDRIFNTVGGFVTLPLKCYLDGECEITVTVHN